MIITKYRYLDIKGFYIICERFTYNIKGDLIDAIYCVFHLSDVDKKYMRLIFTRINEMLSSILVPQNAFYARDFEDILIYISEGK